MPWLRRELGVPVLVEPTSTVSVDHCVQRRQLLTPARETTQADSVDARAVDRLRRRRHLVPRRVVRHIDARGGQEVLAVHQHRGLAIERHRVEVAVVAERPPDAGYEVVGRVGRILGDEWGEVFDPSLLGPQRNLVRADREEVIATALGRHVLGHLLPELVLGQGHDIDLDTRVRALEVGDELFQVGHRGVVDSRQSDRARAAATAPSGAPRTRGACQSNQEPEDRYGQAPVRGSKIPTIHGESPLLNRFEPQAAACRRSRQRCQKTTLSRYNMGPMKMQDGFDLPSVRHAASGLLQR